jgi:N-acetylglutamate synthase-like GNAT family acetyltransferase
VSERVEVRRARRDDAAWIRETLQASWGEPVVARRGRVVDATTLPALVALDGTTRVGLATYRVDGAAAELVTIDALVEGAGVGTALLEAVGTAARGAGCSRLWLITTNDNLRALRFYQRRGLRLVAVHAGAVAEARRLKPSIPLVGRDGIEIRDELELAVEL